MGKKNKKNQDEEDRAVEEEEDEKAAAKREKKAQKAADKAGKKEAKSEAKGQNLSKKDIQKLWEADKAESGGKPKWEPVFAQVDAMGPGGKRLKRPGKCFCCWDTGSEMCCCFLAPFNCLMPPASETHTHYAARLFHIDLMLMSMLYKPVHKVIQTRNYKKNPNKEERRELVLAACTPEGATRAPKVFRDAKNPLDPFDEFERKFYASFWWNGGEGKWFNTKHGEYQGKPKFRELEEGHLGIFSNHADIGKGISWPMAYFWRSFNEPGKMFKGNRASLKALLKAGGDKIVHIETSNLFSACQRTDYFSGSDYTIWRYMAGKGPGGNVENPVTDMDRGESITDKAKKDIKDEIKDEKEDLKDDVKERIEDEIKGELGITELEDEIKESVEDAAMDVAKDTLGDAAMENLDVLVEAYGEFQDMAELMHLVDFDVLETMCDAILNGSEYADLIGALFELVFESLGE